MSTVHDSARLELTPVQYDLQRLQSLAPAGVHALITLEFTLNGPPSESAFREAWRRVVAREPVLHAVAGGSEQDSDALRLDPDLRLPITYGRLDDATSGTLAADQPTPLWSASAVQRDHTTLVVRVVASPALLDQRSRVRLLDLFAREYDAVRSGQSPAAPGVAAEATKIVPWSSAEAAAAFWQGILDDSEPAKFWTAGTASVHTSTKVTVVLSAEEVARLTTVAATLGVSAETIVESAAWLALSRASGSDRARLAVRTTGRATDTTQHLGFHDEIRITAVRGEDAGTARALILSVDRHRCASEPHVRVPLTTMASWDRTKHRSRIAECLLDVDMCEAAGRERESLERRLQTTIGDGSEHARFPFAYIARSGEQTSLCCVAYTSDVSEQAVHAMATGWRAVLRQLIEDVDRPLADVHLAPAAEPPGAASAAMVEWDGGIARLVMGRAAALARESAIECGSETVTYAELASRVALIAGALRAVGVGRGDVVALFLERGVDIPAAVLGILASGAAWMPLDPAYPRARTAEQLRRAGVQVLLTQRTLRDAIAVDGITTVIVEDSSAAQPMEPLSMAPGDLAYLMYTSGSTGTPKGVRISHGSLTHYVSSMIATLGLKSTDRYMHTASMAFSSSVRQLLVPLGAGGTVVMAHRNDVTEPRDLLRIAKSARATVLDLVPSYWARIVEVWESANDLMVPSLRLALSASEPLSSELVRRVLAVAPASCRFVNMFGQTETTGIVVTFDVTPDKLDGAIVPLGRPLTGHRLRIVDQHRQPLPDGLTGEIQVAGPGVALGYHGADDLTAERFLTSTTANGTRWYATGDLGVVEKDGVLRFVGRRDNQVKVRGHRIEVEEVEAVMRRHAAVTDAAVDARIDQHGDTYLVAFFVCASSVPSLRELRDHLAQLLPEYMMPAVLQPVTALPRTPNGKLDRRAVAVLVAEQSASVDAYVAPRTTAERQLATIWEEILGARRVGVSDHFFEIGGHSLMAIRVLARVRTQFGVDVSLRQFFDRPTVAALAELLSAREFESTKLPALVPLPPGTRAPLSFAQERLWVMHQIEPESAAYNLIAAFRLRGELKQTALIEALSEIERRHEALRTVFPSIDGVAHAEVRPPRVFPLAVEQISNTGNRDEILLARAAAIAAMPLDLATGPLFTGTLLKADATDHLLVLVMHHVVSDGWSRGILYSELGALYEAFARKAPSPLPELALSYGDYSAWQRDWLQQDVLARQVEYWTRSLAGPLPTLELPTDRPRPPVQTSRGATHTFVLPAALGTAIHEVASAEDATAFMVLLAGFQTLLGRYSGQEDIVVGSPTAGRTQVETEALIGFFVNTLPLRADLSGDPSFRDLLRRVKRTTLSAFDNQDLPFDRLVEALHLPRDLSRSPVFQTLFILQNVPLRPLVLPGLLLEQVDVDAGAAKFDMTVSLTATDGGYTGRLEYNTDLFDAATIERFASHYVRLLEAATSTPDRPIGHIEYLPPADRQQLLTRWNATDTPVSHTDTIVSQFEAQVRKTPDANAATFEAETLTYAELNRRANRLAHHLRTLEVGPDVAVGIYMERSLEMLIGMLAVMKAGGAYLPLDPAYPADRVEFMLRDSAAPVLLAHGRLVSRLPNINAKVVRVDVDQAQFATQREDDAAPVAQPTHLAYQIYTSGSTGVPKGVMIEHRNAVNFFTGMDERIGSDTPGTWLAVTSISFDISVLELLWTLTRGYHVIVQGDPERVRAQQAVKRSDRHVGFSLFYFASDAQANPTEKYRILLEGAKFADAHGFEAVWTPERHFHAFGGLYPSPAVVSAALAALTKNVKLRTGSVVLPLHSPVRVAEDWSVVDNLSNGRVGLGFASGWHDRDFVFAPQNYANRRDVMVESMETVRRLWRGETVTLPGGSGKDAEVAILPRPIQPELPIWVTAAGTPQTYETAGRIGANVLTHLLGQTPDTLREKIAIYRSARKHAGHTGPGHVSLMLHTYLHEDMEAVKRAVWHPFREYLRTSVDLIKGLAEGRGQDMRSTEFTKEDMDALLDHAFHRYFDTSALMGTPESCFNMVEQLKGMDIDEIACLIDFGVPEAEVMKSLELLGELRRRSDESSASASADFDIPAQLERWQVTHFQCTPSMASMLMQSPEARPTLAGLGCLMIGGEAFPPALASELRSLVRGRVVNMYGPTETTIWSTTHQVTDEAGSVPLGTPIANTRCYVVDRHQELVPVGVPGELLIGGHGVVRGYHARPELTAERFLPDRFRGEGRVYRTGDLVRWRTDGRLDFLGRIDHQVKVRGHRIELGEIESVLEARSEVREAVVVVREFGPGDSRLVGYVVPAVGTVVDPATLRKVVGERLPEYMVPAHIVTLERLPRTPNLKIDRKALPAPSEGPSATTTPFVKPASELESQIAAIWRDVLRVEQVGVNENFFDIGGHSLLTVKVHVRLRASIDRPVSITDLFRFPTIRTLAEHLGGAAPAAPTGERVQARADARREALQNRRGRRGPT